jgi:hypothetical protein
MAACLTVDALEQGLVVRRQIMGSQLRAVW